MAIPRTFVGRRGKCQWCDRNITVKGSYEGVAPELIPDIAKDRSDHARRWHPEAEFVLEYAYTCVMWEHDEDFTRRCENKNIVAKEYCAENKSNGDTCWGRVPEENIRSGIYACGRHAPKVIERIRLQEQRDKERKARAEQDEIDLWVCEQQEHAWQWLKDHGLGGALQAEEAFRKYRDEKRSFYPRSATFDPIKLMEALEGRLRD